MSKSRALVERELAVIFGSDTNRPPWDDEQDEPIRLPGDFPRRGADGPPQVTDPSPDAKIVKSGPRKGRPHYVTYGRPSGYCEIIENTSNLTKWEQRVIAQGFGTDPTLVTKAMALMGDATSLIVRDQDPEWRKKLDGVVMAAFRAGGGELRADQGTAVHRIVELAHNELPIAGLLREIERTGVDVDMPPEILRAMMDAGRAKLDELGLEVVAAEVKLVNDHHRVAGTTDLVLRLTRDLIFTMGDGRQVFLRAGTVIVGDWKCGRVDPRFIHSFCCQLYLYASSVGYDTELEVRTVFPGGTAPIETYGLIFHLPVVEALDGEIVCTVELLDLTVGKRIAECALATNTLYADGMGVTYMGMLDESAEATPVVEVDAPSSTEIEVAPQVDISSSEMTRQGLQPTKGERRVTDVDSVNTDPPSGLNDGPLRWDDRRAEDSFRGFITRRIDALKATSDMGWDEFRSEMERLGIPPMKRAGHTNGQLRAIESAIAVIEWKHQIHGAVVAVPPVPIPDEGRILTSDEVEEFKDAYLSLDPLVRSRVDAWAVEAHRAQLSVHMKESPTERRALNLNVRISLARMENGEMLRAVLAFAVGATWPHMPSLPIGACIGALTIEQATCLLEVAHLLSDEAPVAIDTATGLVELALDQAA